MSPPNADRGPRDEPSTETLSKTTLTSHKVTSLDAAGLLDATVALLDAIDLVVMAALAGREFTAADACEHALAMHGRVRQLLAAVMVEEVVPV